MPGSPDPLISVITPAYNHGVYVQDTIRSVIGQDYRNLEFVIVDDGSSDDTVAKIDALALECSARFTNFVFEKQLNCGIVRTLNMALNFASGKYVFFIASDDVLDPSAISRLYLFLSRNPEYGLVVPDNRIIDQVGRLCFWDPTQTVVYEDIPGTFKTFGDFLRYRRKDVDFLSDEFGSYSTLIRGNYFPCGPLIRRDLLEDLGRFSEKAPLEDHYLMLQVAKRAKLKFLPETLLSYRWHSTNTIKNPLKVLLMALATNQFEREYCRAHGLLGDWCRVQARLLLQVLRLAPGRMANYRPSNFCVLLCGGFLLAVDRARRILIRSKGER